MNQEQIGRFIAECRKKQQLTQEQLAEKLNITAKAVSKWECGKGLPDASIMMDLCKILEISVNDLLSGEKVDRDNYIDRADENLIKMKQSEENFSKESFMVLSIVFAFTVLILFIALLMIDSTHFTNSVNCEDWKNESKENDNENNEECCNGCICGDTIKLLKNTETAWTLTEINRKGEYVYTRSFINFHGTGKNKFAFFKNDDNANTSYEVRGEFTINDKDEIILIPKDDKNNKITCKLGEEKDLIAVMNCDKNFGTFTIQKHGTYELPSIILDTMSKTKTIIVKKVTFTEEDYDYKEVKRITEEKEVKKLLSVINNSKVWTGGILGTMSEYKLELLDVNDNSIATISDPFDIRINGKNYYLINIDKNLLNTIIEK